MFSTGEVVVTACHDRDVVKIRISFHEIPDDLWTTPYQSAKNVENSSMP